MEWLSHIFTPPALVGIAVITGIILTVKMTAPVIKGITHFFDDLRGEEARPGVPARPGIMEAMATLATAQTAQAESLQRLETEQQAQSTKIETIRHEVEFNNGTSVKDSAIRTEQKVNGLVDDISALKAHVLLDNPHRSTTLN